jgi:hypothetical protein
LPLKRKQLFFNEVELGIIADALRNQWWSRYNPEVEKNVQPHHNLLDRVANAQAQFDSSETDS